MSVEDKKSVTKDRLECRVNLTPVDTLDRSFQLADLGASFLEYHGDFGRHRGLSIAGTEEPSTGLRVFEKVVMVMSVLMILSCLPFSLIFCFRIVKQYERVVVFRVGRLHKISGPGTLFLIPCVDRVKILDLRVSSLKVASKDIMLSDSIQISVKVVCWSRIICPLSAVVATEDYSKSTKLLSTGILRRFLGYKKLEQVVSPSTDFSKQLVSEINRITLQFGVKIERMEIKSLKLTKKFQTMMAVEGSAFATAKARKLLSEGERNSAPALTAAAGVTSIKKQ
jgi:erythrocyte band 7 integral membrane protein